MQEEIGELPSLKEQMHNYTMYRLVGETPENEYITIIKYFPEWKVELQKHCSRDVNDRNEFLIKNSESSFEEAKKYLSYLEERLEVIKEKVKIEQSLNLK